MRTIRKQTTRKHFTANAARIARIQTGHSRHRYAKIERLACEDIIKDSAYRHFRGKARASILRACVRQLRDPGNPRWR